MNPVDTTAVGYVVDDIRFKFVGALQDSPMTLIGWSNPVGIVARRVPEKVIWQRQYLGEINR